jgi:hypothetical protein
MVLKVVRGKILETWELRLGFSFPPGRFEILLHEISAPPEKAPGIAMTALNEACSSALKLDRTGSAVAELCWLSKIFDYLVDNIYVHMLSWMMGEVQEKSERVAKLVPKMGNGERGSCG